ncbi:Tad domain-containing protein [Alkalimonas mucilaginosa]|uniref:Tad domain-containing protein n=1 Tax=Alkalimonas mucilaginosa TaxID=3057676 RepID=A0ABU7JJU2_9GAMM|nr:Tad domain-containing protein [Alkalimonas sp. MEB004]MEE2025760.1 Tad domain-containing protein [Alkalimonas sp. MEB004]
MKYQRGQALALGLVFMTLVLMVVLFSFNASQLNLNSNKLQHTADNAAYSMAVLAARDLNYKAYTNRAMVANQISVAQTVGLSSYLEMHTVFLQNASAALGWLPGVGQVIASMSQVMSGVNQVAQPLLEHVLLPAESIALEALSGSQQLLHMAGLVQSFSLPASVITDNDVDARLDFAQNAMFINKFQEHWLVMQDTFDRTQPEQQYSEHVNVIMSSRDQFSSARNQRWPVPFSLPADLPVLRVNTHQRGGSDLFLNNNQEESWTSMDTVSTHVERLGLSCSWRRGCRLRWRRTEVPVGWGGTVSDNRAQLRHINSNSMWGGSRSRNPRASHLAASSQKSMSGTPGYNGIRKFYDFSDRQQIGINETANITVVVSKPTQHIRTSRQSEWGNDRIDPAINEQFFGNRMTTIASANVHYSRPRDLWPRGGNQHEFGNMYNPYWQPKLNETTNQARIQIRGLTGAL